MSIVLSPVLINKLEYLSSKTDDVLSEQAIKLIKTNRKPKNIKVNQANYDKIISQLPPRIYKNIDELVLSIREKIKVNNTNSINYSILTRTHESLKPCKKIKYVSGNIITGRDKEIEKVIETLGKKDKRGVILLGFPGVGKTAVVRAINSHLIERNVPKTIMGCRIYNMDIPYIFTNYKDDPIGTIIKILETASEDDKIILFIDEVHQLLTQKMNDILKPYLTEKIRFIGSTTIDEYHSIITEDRALERRFTIVEVDEPNITETIGMIQGTKSVFEEYHKCSIPNDVCSYLVSNGSRFMGHRKNPDKSLDLMDISCTILNTNEIKEITIKPEDKGDALLNLENDIDELKNTVVVPGNRTLTKEYVDQAISKVTNIEYGAIRNSLDYDYVVDNIRKVILDQDDQIADIANVVNIIKHINYDQAKPLSTLLLVGPSGCGKASACKMLASMVFGSDNNFIEFDMSAFKTEFQLTELRGSPPGYVGYAKSGVLIKEIKNKPQSVIYFRNIDKCHETVVDYLLASIKNGVLVDASDRSVKLNNSIIVFSATMSDTDMKDINKQAKTMGFSATAATDDKMERLSKIVGNGVVKTAESVVIFNDLSSDSLSKIFDMNINHYISMYKISDIDTTELKKKVLSDAKNGKDVLTNLSIYVPKEVFKKLNKGKR